ncbi:Neutral/alkaline non-lysosomal ceramidase, N-terminal [Popillia japonica]|uniref:Neutral ceramidase n=1 Tax=Popillia japonica TaxID=7064 RepID=A0AAW1N545_POPJA
MWRLGAACLLLLVLCSQTKADYQIGVGISDATGPASGVIFMGYAKLTQRGYGLHLRQWSRAFIIDDGTNRIVFVSVDTGMVGYGIKEAVIENLSASYGDIYNVQNVIISGTHTHSTPGGFMEHLLFDITILGHVKQTFEGLVEGITQSIINAHESMVTGKIYINRGELLDANINRSPASYLNRGELLDANINRSPASYLLNPEAEREQYEHDVDKEMVQLKFVNSDDEIIGAINWFPVHPVSMNNTNGYITSDNVGYASILLEKELNDGAFPGQGSVVTAFASTNLGDVSPNIAGPICTNTGLACDVTTSTCEGEAQFCIASGPGEDMFESTKIIAERMYSKALELLNDNAAVEVTGAVSAINQFVDMPEQSATYTLGNGTTITGAGCNAAMGYSFAAGTTDGPGEFGFTQGTTSNDFFWDIVRDLLAPPTEEDIECQLPKPILLATGQMVEPYDWHPRVVSTQLALIGNVAIAAVPGEFSTMAGRRLKNVIKSAMGSSDATVIIAGLSNHYTHYITTYEEYQLQRYEGASTIYGPHTLGIYLQQYGKLTQALVSGTTLDPGPAPYVFDRDKLFSLVFPVILDHPDLDKKYGSVLSQPPSSVSAGSVVTATFVAGHPRNSLMHGSTFLRVERKVDDEWVLVANDAVWETKFRWERTYLAASSATIEWTVPEDVIPGTYRLRYFGAAKSLFGRAQPHSGTTNEFTVI